MVSMPPATKPCEHCGHMFARRPQDRDCRWKERRFCGRKCGSLHANQRAGTDETLIEDLLFLIDPTSPRIATQDIVTRLGYCRLDTLTRRLHRAGRSDLAALILARDNPEISVRAWWDLYVTAITPTEHHEADQKVSAA